MQLEFRIVIADLLINVCKQLNKHFCSDSQFYYGWLKWPDDKVISTTKPNGCIDQDTVQLNNHLWSG